MTARASGWMVTARYIRVVLTATHPSQWWGISEFNVYTIGTANGQ